MISHKTALIIFWSLVGITIVSWSLTFYLVESLIDIDGNISFTGINLAMIRVLAIIDLLFIPLIVMIPLIGSGFFNNKNCVMGTN